VADTTAAYRALPDEDRFCAICEVDLGLHGTDEPDEDGFDCRIAQQKAYILTGFFSAFAPARPEAVRRDPL
jgi:hypothetical protein